MIKDNQTHLNRAHVVVDGLLVAGSYMLSYYIKFESFIGDRNPAGHLAMETYFSALYFLVPGFLFLYYLVNLYTSRRALKLWDEFVDIVQANIVGVIGFYVILFMLKQNDFSRTMIAIFAIINVIVTTIAHGLLRKFLRYIRKKGYNIKHILLVGYSRAAEGYISRILENPQWGYDVAGILDDFVPVDTSYHGVKVVGKIDQLGDYLANGGYDEITITLPLNDYDRLEELVAQCEKSGVHTKFIPDYSSLFPSNPYTEDVQGLPVINIRYVPLTNSFNRMSKRLVDIVGSLLAIILFSPVMLAAAIAVKATSKGPIIYKQERIGLNGEPFMMYKFRTMKVQSEAEEKKGWTTKNDPRVTKVGALLRKTSIDEMPQFFNIFFGKMSLVGPRPERPQFVEKFKEQIPRYMVKHQVRPGLTGWAQINGYRGDTSIRKRIDYDIYYIENWSMTFDMKIILGTIRYGFVNKNAY
ncbi:exopolysaccharide biosynthesis polyprenyl glycosylphosphotransferase [Butyrivibrio proteoclasticus B316]|uniref:Exopolysaccharide biosynthesis polyprenyl glycosylphosphotransferase n=1 Tax=Butyrivibrio proteoclasticus (strain ATCC 51982 / DSM 14932 / B316) TaxID=515622 RepID=E0S0H8_BUTPB|nr:undecaprenyl-phosphate glucose phosphotransferase [Butyrivibrio proteoclasticus]ADL33303.1 exopolysaccharide biosynthesis polyprenyl glycosylphosphotransferase [Butyrivibrio proteoclasticus B316]